VSDSGDPRDLDGSKDNKCPHCKSKCSDATECGMNMIADPDIETPYYDKAEESEGGDSSSTVKGDSQSLSNGEEPPTPSFDKLHFSEQKFVREEIQTCSDGGHVQQVAYSTYHDALTQVCFSCETVRTSMSEDDLE